jgi:hypothetical protein
MIDGLGRRADGGTAERLPRRWPQYLSNRTGSGTGQMGGSLGPKPASRAATVTPSYVNAGSRCNGLREPRATKWVNCPIGPKLLWDGRYRLLLPHAWGRTAAAIRTATSASCCAATNPQDTCHPAGLMEIHRGS